ncbi:Fic family protein [Ralstonia pseudosolanacearum]|uniref:Fic family protein n=1 Tax=Ralstonia pseudosolanacearum TaxID=1310165 RepID=UPI0040542F71
MTQSEVVTFQRSLFAWPEWGRLRPEARLRLTEASAQVRNVRLWGRLSDECLPSAAHPFWIELRHALSWAFETGSFDDQRVRRRLDQEVQACVALSDDLLIAFEQADDARFIGVLDRACARVTGRPMSIRATAHVRTRAERGASIAFPPAADIVPRMRVLLAFIRQEDGSTALFKAMVALVALTNCHPYANGNGRMARWLFNGVLRWRGGLSSGAYVPLLAFFERSQGGFLIRQRRAEIYGDWDDLALYLCRIIEMWSAPADLIAKVSHVT